MKRLGIIGMTLFAAALIGAAPAAAHTKSFKTTVTATFTPGPNPNSVSTNGLFTGSVQAGGGCRSKRTVVVSSSRQDVGAYKTNSAGQYSSTPEPGVQPTFYYYEDNPHTVIASRSVITKGDKHKHKCKPATSPPVDVFSARGSLFL